MEHGILFISVHKAACQPRAISHGRLKQAWGARKRAPSFGGAHGARAMQSVLESNRSHAGMSGILVKHDSYVGVPEYSWVF